MYVINFREEWSPYMDSICGHYYDSYNEAEKHLLDNGYVYSEEYDGYEQDFSLAFICKLNHFKLTKDNVEVNIVDKENLRDEILAFIENFEWYLYDRDLEHDEHYNAIYEGMRDLQKHLFKTFDLYTYAKEDEQVSGDK